MTLLPTGDVKIQYAVDRRTESQQRSLAGSSAWSSATGSSVRVLSGSSETGKPIAPVAPVMAAARS
jgi:hypothetical protein